MDRRVGVLHACVRVGGFRSPSSKPLAAPYSNLAKSKRTEKGSKKTQRVSTASSSGLPAVGGALGLGRPRRGNV